MMPKYDLERILALLKSSPLAQLSLSSRELFHSNFLAWLCKHYPAVGCASFGSFVRARPDGIKEVAREKKNIDLWLHFTNGEHLIIENKVKSVPTLSQLGEYSAKVGTDQTSFLLLSLGRPLFLSDSDSSFKDDQGKEWKYLSYGDLSKRLKETKTLVTDTYHGLILKDYIDYVATLDTLYNHFSLKLDSTDSFTNPEGLELIQQDRFCSGVLKMRYAQLAGSQGFHAIS